MRLGEGLDVDAELGTDKLDDAATGDASEPLLLAGNADDEIDKTTGPGPIGMLVLNGVGVIVVVPYTLIVVVSTE